MGKENVVTAYPNFAPTKFTQDGLGKDNGKDGMPVPAEHTKVERWHRGEPRLEEYKGCGKLQGKACLVTGADSGIGRSVAVFFAREGADVTVAYVKEEEEDAQVTKRLIEEAGQKCNLVPGDLRTQDERKRLIKAHIDAFGSLDVLVNNASKQIQCKDLKDIDMDNVNDTFQANIIQYIGTTKEALPYLKRGDCVIMTTSVTAYKGDVYLPLNASIEAGETLCPSAGMVDYSATKGAMNAFIRSLALQQVSNGIRVCGVAPGPVYTPLQPASRSAEQMQDWGVDSIPLHGRVGQPAELGESYVYLATSNLSTGTIVHPNSGQYFVA